MNLISEEGAIQAAVSFKTKELIKALNFLKKIIPRNTKGKIFMCEVTVKTNEVEFVVVGAKRSLKCQAFGPAKFTVSFLYFYDMVTNGAKLQSYLSVGNGFISLNDTIIYVDTCFFENDSILRSIKLPTGYRISDLLAMSMNYTEEEIAFNKLTDEYKNAFKTLGNDLKIISGKLKKYGYTKQEVEKFMYDKIFKRMSVGKT